MFVGAVSNTGTGNDYGTVPGTWQRFQCYDVVWGTDSNWTALDIWMTLGHKSQWSSRVCPFLVTSYEGQREKRLVHVAPPHERHSYAYTIPMPDASTARFAGGTVVGRELK
jgi:hypothetical protein